MDKEYFTELTNDIYRLTLLFPKKEPLRYRLRESANLILENLIMILEGDSDNYKESAFKIKKNIGILNTFLDIAKEQNWVSEEQISGVQEKYYIIKEEIEKFEKNGDNEEESTPTPVNYQKERPMVVLTSRQEKIVELLKQQEKVQIKDTHAVLPEITKRTLRRDFDVLLKSGIVKRVGRANATFYKLADKES